MFVCYLVPEPSRSAAPNGVREPAGRNGRESILRHFCRRKSGPTCGRGSPRHVRTTQHKRMKLDEVTSRCYLGATFSQS